jgi:beta-phosphoglucomutase-like phosphatase (HAD superfamily)
VARLAEIYRLGVASSSPLELIEYSLELAGMRRHFEAVVSSDEVATGKPAPDVYQEACRRLGSTPAGTVAVEDSSNGLLAAHAAGLAVVAIPNPEFPPTEEALATADLVLVAIEELTPEVVAELG